jgi:hypothetical protein
MNTSEPTPMRQLPVMIYIIIAIGTDKIPAVKADNWRGERFLVDSIVPGKAKL